MAKFPHSTVIVLTHIKRIENIDPKKFDVVYTAFEQGFTKRFKYQNFPLCEGLQSPRLPTKDRAIKELQRLAENNEILLGNTVHPHKITAVDSVTSERVEIEVHSRKIEFSDLRQFTLKRHQKYLRAPGTKYEDLDKKQILSMLEDYAAHQENHASLDENELRNLAMVVIWAPEKKLQIFRVSL